VQDSAIKYDNSIAQLSDQLVSYHLNYRKLREDKIGQEGIISSNLQM
jgi:hypothetical protein